jgi:hypothetical protein
MTLFWCFVRLGSGSTGVFGPEGGAPTAELTGGADAGARLITEGIVIGGAITDVGLGGGATVVMAIGFGAVMFVAGAADGVGIGFPGRGIGRQGG